MTTTEIMLLSLLIVLIVLIIPLTLLCVELTIQRRLNDKLTKLSDEQAEHIKRLDSDYNSLADSFENLAKKYNK